MFDRPQTEFIGLAFAVVVLILAFGSVLAMGLPLAVALGGVGAGIGLIVAPQQRPHHPRLHDVLVAIMIGLGVGIDYALFIVTRYREGLHAGLSPRAATIAAMDTAGRAVIFAGLTVVVSLLGLLLIGLASLSGLAIGAAVTVLVTMITSITLLPALLGFAGPRVEVTRWRGLIMAGFVAVALFGIGIGVPALAAAGARARRRSPCSPASSSAPAPRRSAAARSKPVRETLAYRWSRTIQRRPWRWLVAGTVVLARPGRRRSSACASGSPTRATTPRTPPPAGLRPAGRGLRRRLQRSVHHHRPARRRRHARRGRRRSATPSLATPGVAAVTEPILDDPGAPAGRTS